MSDSGDTSRIARYLAKEELLASRRVPRDQTRGRHPTIPPTRIELPSWLEDAPAPVVPATPRVWRDSFQLVVHISGGRVARQVFTHPRVRIGRSNDCELRLNDPTISRFHAAIERTEVGYTLLDLGSSNGIRVNGKKVHTWQLNHGDLIAVGEYELLFHEDTVAPHPPQPLEPQRSTMRDTLRLPAEQNDAKERSAGRRAYLRVADSSQPRIWPRTAQFVLERDVFLIGSGAEADLRIQAWRVPRIACVIVRGVRQYWLDSLVTWPVRARLNGRTCTGVEALADRDEIVVAGRELVFQLGRRT